VYKLRRATIGPTGGGVDAKISDAVAERFWLGRVDDLRIEASAILLCNS
jgi:hypothetical protein